MEQVDTKWQASLHEDEPRDQHRDLLIAGHSYWASIGPDIRRKPDGWSWTILEFTGQDSEEIAEGFADDEAAAKAAVAEWESAHQGATPAPLPAPLPVAILHVTGLPSRCPRCGAAQEGGLWALTVYRLELAAACRSCHTAIAPVRAAAAG
jgi:hypothetical protein